MQSLAQALAPYHHAPAIYCRASPLVLQLAVATTTVVRKVSVICGEESCYNNNKASYSPSTQPH
eukprot:3449302-Pleurochrysis_carterae.AAC.1